MALAIEQKIKINIKNIFIDCSSKHKKKKSCIKPVRKNEERKKKNEEKKRKGKVPS